MTVPPGFRKEDVLAIAVGFEKRDCKCPHCMIRHILSSPQVQDKLAERDRLSTDLSLRNSRIERILELCTVAEVMGHAKINGYPVVFTETIREILETPPT